MSKFLWIKKSFPYHSLLSAFSIKMKSILFALFCICFASLSFTREVDLPDQPNLQNQPQPPSQPFEQPIPTPSVQQQARRPPPSTTQDSLIRPVEHRNPVVEGARNQIFIDQPISPGVPVTSTNGKKHFPTKEIPLCFVVEVIDNPVELFQFYYGRERWSFFQNGTFFPRIG